MEEVARKILYSYDTLLIDCTILGLPDGAPHESSADNYEKNA
jgi:hypothetical protein